MYPVFRVAKEFASFRNAAPMDILDTHVSHHRCWPHDLDIWMELNNGRTLTLYDLGRLVYFQRTGIIRVMKERRWAGTIAGASVRYRHRVRMFDRLEMRTRALGWDARFLYLDQSMWRGEECTSHILLRSAVTSKDGMVPMEEATRALDHATGESPALPDWVAAWIAADAERPWPPLR